MKLLVKEQQVYDRIYTDLLEPDQLDIEIVTQIAQLTIQVKKINRQVKKDGLIISYTTTKGTDTIKAHPLTDVLKQLQSNLSTQLNKLAAREDARAKEIFKRELSIAERDLK